MGDLFGKLLDALPEPWKTVAWMTVTMFIFCFNLIFIANLAEAKTDGWIGAWVFMLFSFLVPLCISLVVIYRKCVLVSREKGAEQTGLLSTQTPTSTPFNDTNQPGWSIYGPHWVLIIMSPALIMFLWGIPVLAKFKGSLHNNTAPMIYEMVHTYTIVDVVLFGLISLAFLLVAGVTLYSHLQPKNQVNYV